MSKLDKLEAIRLRRKGASRGEVLRKLGISPPQHQRAPYPESTKHAARKLSRLYFSTREITNLLGVASLTSVRRWLLEAGLMRGRKEAIKLYWEFENQLRREREARFAGGRSE